MSPRTTHRVSDGDPVGRKTDWTPLAQSGGNYRSHKLVELAPGRFAFRDTLGHQIFIGIVLVAGFASCGLGIYAALGSSFATVASAFLTLAQILLPLGVGLAFILGARYVYRRESLPRVFATDLRWYWRGEPPRDREELIRREDAIELDEVHAIQILREPERGESYDNYELNLVTRDGARLHVVAHGHGPALRRDAFRLAEQLGVGVWDAT